MNKINESHYIQSSPVQVLAVTSGKGGVGKTNVSINLAVALANRDRRVMLMDADLGLANIDVMLGLAPKLNLSHVLDGSSTLQDVIIHGPSDVLIVPASSGIQHMAALSEKELAGHRHGRRHQRSRVVFQSRGQRGAGGGLR